MKSYKLHCLSCHGKRGVAMVLPSDKAAIQWKRFFARKKHTPALSIGEKEEAILLKFMEEHAADSDRPTVPGL